MKPLRGRRVENGERAGKKKGPVGYVVAGTLAIIIIIAVLFIPFILSNGDIHQSGTN